MKKIIFDDELRNSLKNLREKLGPVMTDESKSQIAGGACGGLCKITCSYHCRADILSSEITSVEPN